MMRQRHNLVWISDTGIKEALRNAIPTLRHIPAGWTAELLQSGIPAIVRRQEIPREEIIEVGFSSYLRPDGVRFRVSAEVPAASVTRVMTPFQVLKEPLPEHPKVPLLLELKHRVEAHGMRLGVYGSTALELITGLPYTHAESDLDLFLQMAQNGDPAAFYAFLKAWEEEHGIRADAELDIGGGFAVKCGELFSGQKTVLAKGYSEVQLFSIAELLGNGRLGGVSPLIK